jgi:hypothetical protein
MEELGLLLEVGIGLLLFGRLRLERCFTSCLGTRGLLRGLIYILGESGDRLPADKLVAPFYLAVRLGHSVAVRQAELCGLQNDKADKQRTNHPNWIKRYEFTIG